MCYTACAWGLMSDRSHLLGNLISINSLACCVSRQHGSFKLGVHSSPSSHLTPPPYAFLTTYILTHCSDPVNLGSRKHSPKRCMPSLWSFNHIWESNLGHISLVTFFFLFIPILSLPHISLKSHCFYYSTILKYHITKPGLQHSWGWTVLHLSFSWAHSSTLLSCPAWLMISIFNKHTSSIGSIALKFLCCTASPTK